MLNKKVIIIVAVLITLISGSLLVAASSGADQLGVLAGRVSYIVPVGKAVAEGDILVKVDALTGPVPAARANTRGIVSEVLVAPGDPIAIGQVVARVQASK